MLVTKKQTQDLCRQVEEQMKQRPRAERAAWLRQIGVDPRQLRRWRKGAVMRTSTFRRLTRQLQLTEHIDPFAAWHSTFQAAHERPGQRRLLLLDLQRLLMLSFWERHLPQVESVFRVVQGHPLLLLELPVSAGISLICSVEPFGPKAVVLVLKLAGLHTQATELLTGPPTQQFVAKLLNGVRRVLTHQKRVQRVSGQRNRTVTLTDVRSLLDESP